MSGMFSACGLLFAAAIAVAPLEPHAAPPSRIVALGDLNLETDAGGHTLLRRISLAARVVCRESNGDAYDPLSVLTYRACVERAIKTSVTHVDSERLTRIYRSEFVGLHTAKD